MQLNGLTHDDVRLMFLLFPGYEIMDTVRVQLMIDWMIENEVEKVSGWYDEINGAYCESNAYLNENASYSEAYIPRIARWLIEVYATANNYGDRQPSGEYTVADLKHFINLINCKLTMELPV